MSKITAIISGGDWNDASVDHLVIPPHISLQEAKEAWMAWYNQSYLPALRRQENPQYVSYVDWLKECGARDPTRDELEVFENV